VLPDPRASRTTNKPDAVLGGAFGEALVPVGLVLGATTGFGDWLDGDEAGLEEDLGPQASSTAKASSSVVRLIRQSTVASSRSYGIRLTDLTPCHQLPPGVVRKEGIECSQKPIGCTLEDCGEKVERETGFVVPATKHHVEFVYRLRD
jgi:hypothetical protein